MENELSIEIRLIGDILGIVLDGSLNAATSEEFNQAIRNYLNVVRKLNVADLIAHHFFCWSMNRVRASSAGRNAGIDLLVQAGQRRCT